MPPRESPGQAASTPSQQRSVVAGPPLAFIERCGLRIELEVSNRHADLPDSAIDLAIGNPTVDADAGIAVRLPALSCLSCA